MLLIRETDPEITEKAKKAVPLARRSQKRIKQTLCKDAHSNQLSISFRARKRFKILKNKRLFANFASCQHDHEHGRAADRDLRSKVKVKPTAHSSLSTMPILLPFQTISDRQKYPLNGQHPLDRGPQVRAGAWAQRPANSR